MTAPYRPPHPPPRAPAAGAPAVTASLAAPRELRIGHAERDAASTELAEHYALGRIDYEEHTRRLDQIWAARTASELRAAFVDLPGAYHQPAPLAGQPLSPTYAWRGRPQSHLGPWFTRLPGPIQAVLVLLLVAMVAANLPIIMVVGVVWLLLRRGPRG